MSIYIKIKRQDKFSDNSYYQIFEYDGDYSKTIADVLRDLNNNDELKDVEGQVTRKITWQCSCIEKKCGACAMRINGRPVLACSVFIRDLQLKDNTITIEPLRKFPVIEDLWVDRHIILEKIKKYKLFLENEAHIQKEKVEDLYDSSKCLMCGICLEVCPSYQRNGDFGGAVMMNAAFRIINQTKDENEKKKLLKEYRETFADGCRKDFACSRVCPAGIDLNKILSSFYCE